MGFYIWTKLEMMKNIVNLSLLCGIQFVRKKIENGTLLRVY